MDWSEISRNVAKFEQENRLGEPYVTEGQWRFFASGATREISQLGYGALLPPHPDPKQRNRTIAYYWALRLRYAVDEFKSFKATIRRVLNSGESLVRIPVTGERLSYRDLSIKEAMSQLRELQDEVKKCKQKAEEAEFAVTGLTREEAEKQRREAALVDAAFETKRTYELIDLEKIEV